jgi:hypothetical protein
VVVLVTRRRSNPWVKTAKRYIKSEYRGWKKAGKGVGREGKALGKTAAKAGFFMLTGRDLKRRRRR